MKKIINHLIIAIFIITTYVQSGSVKIGWNVKSDATQYEVVLIREVSLTEYWYGTTGNLITVPKPKSGKYEVRVRPVYFRPDGSRQNGDWCSSLEESCSLIKTGTPGGWKLYWKPGSILGPVIITPKSSMWFEGIDTAEQLFLDRS